MGRARPVRGAIELHRISRIFNQGTPAAFTALSDVTLSLGAGELTVLKGPSGSGKTTLLSLMGCMSRPTSGRIYLGGGISFPDPFPPETDRVEISSLPERFLALIRRHTFGFIFQQFNLMKGISVLQNVLLPLLPLGLSEKEMVQIGEKLLDRFSLARHRDRPVDHLSGGEMQRVAIARALVNDPQIVIADEPTAHLDSKLSHELMAILKELKEEGRTVVVASHDPIVYDSRAIDRIVEMRDGRVMSVT